MVEWQALVPRFVVLPRRQLDSLRRSYSQTESIRQNSVLCSRPCLDRTYTLLGSIQCPSPLQLHLADLDSDKRIFLDIVASGQPICLVSFLFRFSIKVKLGRANQVILCSGFYTSHNTCGGMDFVGQ